MRPARQPGRGPVRFWLISVVVGAALFLVPWPGWAVEEFYSRDLFPLVQNGLTAASNLVPVAVLDLFVGLAAVVVFYRAVRLGGTAIARGVGPAVGEGLRRAVRFAAVVAIAFMGLWGLNYRRVPLETTLAAGAAVQPTEADLVAAVSDAGRLATRLRPAARRAALATIDDVAAALGEPMNKALVGLNREPLARPGRPKVSRLLTPFFTWSGTDGMVNPLALESILHPDLLPFEQPYVLAHEWAHLAGHADEAEASAVGWFACMHGPPALAYSASLYLVMEGGAALSGPARTRAFATLGDGVRADLEAIRQRLLRQKPAVQRVTSEVYDTYLKANRVADGRRSYGRALSVILSPPLRDALRTY